MKVRATETVSVYVTGTKSHQVIREGQAFDSKDPIVKEHSWLFESDIEQATAAPGEKR